MAAKIQNLIDECKAKGIKVSMRDIAREIGVHYSTIVKIKRGEIANPRIKLLQSICAYFSEKLGRPVTLDELVQRAPEELSAEVRADVATIQKSKALAEAALSYRAPGEKQKFLYQKQMNMIESQITRLTQDLMHIQAWIQKVRQEGGPYLHAFEQRARLIQYRIEGARELASAIREAIDETGPSPESSSEREH